jgi:flagellar hook-associated protein 2
MTSFNITGLSSGIDTSALITQLMTLAAAPQTALENQLSATQTELSAFQTLNTKLAAVKSAADTLALSSTWAATSATSSDTSILATGSSNALAGTATSFSVTAVAQAQTSTLALSDPNNAADSSAGLTLTIGGTSTTLSLAGNAATDVVSAVNSANLGVRASIIATSTGSVLQFSSTASGTANSFDISGLSGSLQTLTAAQDASITVGSGPAAYTVSSSTNTFANAIPGVTFSVSKLTANATISVATDATSISNAVSALVNATNDALKTIGAATGKGAVLAGDNTVSSLTQKLLGVISAGTSGKSFSTAGVGITSAGQLTFDAAAFASAYAKDPTGIQSMVRTGLATGLSTAGSNATDPGTGTLSQLITADNTQISSLTKQISAWDSKLATQKSTLEAKFAAMEAALSKLKSQSSFLTSVFSSSTTSTSTPSSTG